MSEFVNQYPTDSNYKEAASEACFTTPDGQPVLATPTFKSGAEQLGISEDEYWGGFNGGEQSPAPNMANAATAEPLTSSTPTPELDDWFGAPEPTNSRIPQNPQKVPKP